MEGERQMQAAEREGKVSPLQNRPRLTHRPKRMDAKRPWGTTFFLLFFLCYRHVAAHPINDLSPAEALADMEALLERLEEKVALMEDLQSVPEDSQAQEEISNAQPGINPFPVFSDRSSLLKHMRGIQAAKSMRESGCFGRRLDRIGSVSGMGCKGLRRN